MPGLGDEAAIINALVIFDTKQVYSPSVTDTLISDTEVARRVLQFTITTAN